MQILYYVSSIASLVCWIIILVKMFQRAGVLQGILGIICGLWAFIWGWMNVNEHGQKPVMIVWSICFVINIATGVMTGMEQASQM
jgi:hypothetical protein